MPSTKSPSSLQIGPGRLPGHVAPVVALPSSSATNAAVSDLSVVSVNGVSTALTRTSSYMVVLVNNLTGSFTVTLPQSPRVGDIITLIGTTSGTAEVTIAPGSGDAINGVFDSERLVGAFSSRSFTCMSAGDGWASFADKPSIQVVTASVTLKRAGATQLVLVDTTAGDLTLTLPPNSQVGDRLTFVKTVSSGNSVTIARNGSSDKIDGRDNTTLLSNLGSLTLLRVSSTAAIAWATLAESASIVEVTNSFDLGTASLNTSKDIRILVRTLDSAWISGTKTITLPLTLSVQPGSTLTITDMDGGAPASPILIAGGVLGVTSTGISSYTLVGAYGSVSLVAKTGGAAWSIVAESTGLVEDFSTLGRVDSRADLVTARLATTPMFNWSQRKVAIHAEFNGLITNILPVDGFSAGGSMTLSAGPGGNGTVGSLRCTVPLGLSGYIHLGSLPTDDIFDPTQLLGFRAIITLQTANPGADYDVAIGFGDDISDTSSLDDLLLGANSLYIATSSGGAWRRSRQASGVGSGTNMTAITAGSRYVVEYYFSGTTWDSYINGVKGAGTATNVPTALLNFGMAIRDDGGGSVPFVVDIDSLTIFTLDLGATRHNP